MNAVVGGTVGMLKVIAEGFLQRLKDHYQLLKEVPALLKQLTEDIVILKSYMEEYGSRSNSNDIVTSAILNGVREKIYKAEDEMDSYAMEVAYEDRSWKMTRMFRRANPFSRMGDFSQHIKDACDSVHLARLDVQNHLNSLRSNLTINVGITNTQFNGDHQEHKEPSRQVKYGPIFEDEEDVLRSRLGKEGDELDVIVITGMHGIGKTTLAAKMFYDQEIREKFPNPIWISVCNRKPEYIYRSILSRIKKSPDQVQSNDQELVAKCLEQQLLIVMDDVQYSNDLDELKDAFRNGNKKSKVLVTTCEEKVRRCFSQSGDPIALGILGNTESWSLLKWRVDKDHGCPDKSEANGLLIANQCEGLPIAIDSVGHLLSITDSRTHDIIERRRIWEDFAREMPTYFSRDGDKKTIILSSYYNLTNELKACFLYLGIFARGSTFSVSKLTRMWIAEGFIRADGSHSLETTAEKHLKELVDGKLVIAVEKMPNGSLKSCRMNYLFHELCKIEAGQEKKNFFQEFVQNETDGEFFPKFNDVGLARRFCVHTRVEDFMPTFINSRTKGTVFLHSFVSHSNNPVPVQKKDISTIPEAFKLLRVLDAERIEFPKIPSGMCQLIYLRFITITVNQAFLPESISNLRNVQTLIVHTPSRTLEVKGVILKMGELRHFKTSASATFSKKNEDSDKHMRFQTLCGVSPKSCTKKLLEKTPNLKKLGIHGQLALLLRKKKDDLLVKSVHLQKLKLRNDGTSSNLPDKLSSLIQPKRFPPSLRSLTLSNTCLGWVHISVLASMKLEDLKLKDNAFIGDTWTVSGEGFPHLQTLRMEDLDFAHWISSGHHFPELRRLELFKCKKLQKIPLELASSTNFKRLHLRNGIPSAVASARRIESEIKQTLKIKLDLTIFPEDLTANSTRLL